MSVENLDTVSTGLDNSEISDLIAYVNGKRSDPPEALNGLMTNIYQKMSTVAGYSVAAEVQRQSKLTKFLAKIEDELFDESLLASMSREDLMDLHKRVSDESAKSQEFTRKWLAQNKGVLNGKQTDVEKLAAKLSTLPKEKLEMFERMLDSNTAPGLEDSIEEL